MVNISRLDLPRNTTKAAFKNPLFDIGYETFLKLALLFQVCIPNLANFASASYQHFFPKIIPRIYRRVTLESIQTCKYFKSCPIKQLLKVLFLIMYHENFSLFSLICTAKSSQLRINIFFRKQLEQ